MLDIEAHRSFNYGLGLPYQFAKGTIAHILKIWDDTTEETKSNIISRLESLIEKENEFRVEEDLMRTFTGEDRNYYGPLGERRAAEVWKKFYEEVTTRRRTQNQSTPISQ